jgi:hypothetical protein
MTMMRIFAGGCRELDGKRGVVSNEGRRSGNGLELVSSSQHEMKRI